MNSVFVDATATDQGRRERLYAGQLFLYSPRPSTVAFCEFARDMIRQAFHPLEPEEAQHRMPVEEYAALLARLKPQFINHPESKRQLQRILVELGCDPQKTYFDVPRMRTATSNGYLTTGIAYAWHPHRDTWYSAPFCQINWWLPIYDIEPANAMAFHPRYWSQPVKNGSRDYDYARWNRESRHVAAQHIKSDTRKQPRPEEPIELDPQVRVICPAGGIIVFSGAQLHSTVPNTSGRTRFSIDFRTVHLDDVLADRGAPNVDSACTGTTMGDYPRGTDFIHLPAELIARYEDATALPAEALPTRA
jgi:hypothetical protein